MAIARGLDEDGVSLRVRPSPLYEQIKEEIRQRIGAGIWPTGTVLPSENDLASSLGVAVGTVRRALKDLAIDGIVARRPKTGTVVTGRTPHHRLEMCFRYFRLHGPGDSLHTSHSRVISFERRPASREETVRLELGDGAEICRVRRVRLVDTQPIMWDDIMLPGTLVPEIRTADDLPAALSSYLLDRHGMRITAQREKLSADLANSDDRRFLEKKGQFAVLVIDAVSFNHLGRPLMSSHHRAVTGSFKYINEVS